MTSKENLKLFKNEKLAKIGMFNHALWLCFGDEITIINEFGIPTTTYPFTLHVNCSWRFSDREKIILAKQDIFTMNDNFNEKVSIINGKLQRENVIVEFVECNEFFDVKIMLSDKIRIDFFSDTSILHEQLKFISQRNVDTSQNEDVQVVASVNEIADESIVESDDFKQRIEVNDEFKENRLITELFENNRFKKFHAFCHLNTLIYANDITPQILWVFGQTKGVGQATIPKIERILDIEMEKPSIFEQSKYLEKFKTLDITAPNKEGILDINIEIVDQDILENESLIENFAESLEDTKEENILITKIFEGSTYGLFREFCIKENLRFASDITDDLLLKFRQSQSVGRKRYLDIVNRLQEFDYTEITTDFKGGEIFKEVLISQFFENSTYGLFHE